MVMFRQNKAHGIIMNQLKASTLAISCCTLLLLVGCGGGNSNNTVVPDVEPTPISTGHFTDSAVEGLTYTTETQSGITDETGAFSYKAGETVSFSIGDVVIGETVSAKAEMTPVDLLVGAFLPTTKAELTSLTGWFNRDKPEVIRFNELGNILVFLQSLDEDKDASNGITVRDGMAAILEGVSIDFSAYSSTFRNAAVLKTVMSEAVTQGLMSSNDIKSPRNAFNHFYEAQEINYSFATQATMSEDENGDGTVNRIETSTYDADGNRLTYSTDDNGDGTVNRIVTSTYDADGNELTNSTDDNVDGTVNRIVTYTYAATTPGVHITFL